MKKEEEGGEKYRISKEIKANNDVVEALQRNFAAKMDPSFVNTGLNATADSFYSSQVFFNSFLL